MINQAQKIKLIDSLLNMFRSAKETADKEALRPRAPKIDESSLTPEQQTTLRQYQATLPVVPQSKFALIPQACALLLSTGQTVGGVAANPVTLLNLEAEDAISMAHSTLKTLPGLKPNFHIVAIAMTIVDDQQSPHEDVIDLFEQTLSDLPNLKAPHMLLVCPVTENIEHSQPFSDYRIA